MPFIFVNVRHKKSHLHVPIWMVLLSNHDLACCLFLPKELTNSVDLLCILITGVQWILENTPANTKNSLTEFRWHELDFHSNVEPLCSSRVFIRHRISENCPATTKNSPATTKNSPATTKNSPATTKDSPATTKNSPAT